MILSKESYTYALPAPSGEQILFHNVWGGEFGPKLYLDDLSTGARHEFLNSFEPTDMIRNIAWSPDGASIVYSTRAGSRSVDGQIKGGSELDEQIVVSSPDESRVSRVKIEGLGLVGPLYDLHWSDAQTLLLLSMDDAAVAHLYQIKTSQLDAGGLTLLGSIPGALDNYPDQGSMNEDRYNSIIYVPTK